MVVSIDSARGSGAGEAESAAPSVLRDAEGRVLGSIPFPGLPPRAHHEHRFAVKTRQRHTDLKKDQWRGSRRHRSVHRETVEQKKVLSAEY